MAPLVDPRQVWFPVAWAAASAVAAAEAGIEQRIARSRRTGASRRRWIQLTLAELFRRRLEKLTGRIPWWYWTIRPEGLDGRSELPQTGRRKCSPLPRAKSQNLKKASRRVLEATVGLSLFEPPSEKYDRPATRGDCEAGGINEARPCPWVSCKYHLALSIHEETGSLKHVWPDAMVGDDEIDLHWIQQHVGETCALDVAIRREMEGGETPLEEVGRLQNLGIERVRQLEAQAKQDVRVLYNIKGLGGKP